MVTRSHQRLLIPLDRTEVRELLERVASELGWALEHQTRERARFREEASRLHCHCSPLEASVDLAQPDAGSTELTIEGRVPGWGPLAWTHVQEQTGLLARRIGLAAIEQREGRPAGRSGNVRGAPTG